MKIFDFDHNVNLYSSGFPMFSFDGAVWGQIDRCCRSSICHSCRSTTGHWNRLFLSVCNNSLFRIHTNLVLVDIIQPTLPILSLPIDLLIAVNLWCHYAFACKVKPGFVDEPPKVAGHTWIWAKPRRRQAHTFPPNGSSTGVRWTGTLNITDAKLTRCRKCGLARPEVSSVMLISEWRY